MWVSPNASLLHLPAMAWCVCAPLHTSTLSIRIMNSTCRFASPLQNALDSAIDCHGCHSIHLSIIFHPTNSLWACAHSVSSKSCLSISLRKPVQRPTHPTSIIGIMPVLHVWKNLWFQVWWNRHGQRRGAFARKLRKLLCLFKDFIEMGNKLQSATLCPLGKTGFSMV